MTPVTAASSGAGPEWTTVMLPGDTAVPAPLPGQLEQRVRDLHAATVVARADAAAAAARHTAAEAAFDAALDTRQPLPVLRLLDRAVDTAARQHRAATQHAEQLARMLVNATVVTGTEVTTRTDTEALQHTAERDSSSSGTGKLRVEPTTGRRASLAAAESAGRN